MHWSMHSIPLAAAHHRCGVAGGAAHVVCYYHIVHVHYIHHYTTTPLHHIHPYSIPLVAAHTVCGAAGGVHAQVYVWCTSSTTPYAPYHW